MNPKQPVSSQPPESIDVVKAGIQLHIDAMSILQEAPCWMTGAERLMLYSLIYSLRPKLYFEIGTLYGGSALIVNTALQASSNPAPIVCLDTAPQIAPAHWDLIKHRTTLITGASPQSLPEASNVHRQPFDFALIDGDHSHQAVLRDAQAVLPLMATGGYLLFHDNFNDDVRSAVDLFVEANRSDLSDCGILTREHTTGTDATGRAVKWAGLRLLRVHSAT